MQKVKIIGVPEHFNYPWHMAIEEGAFKDRGIDLEWIDVPEGTGKMNEMLKTGEADLAIILTEGTVKSITEGNPCKIVQEYIATPLHWGIHVAAKSDFKTVADLNGAKAAISRYGSGSHLMAYVNALEQHWETITMRFEVVNNIDGAAEALTEGKADYFMWELFTTKPWVDKGTFRCVGTCPTPWPCFVIAATDEFLANNKKMLAHILDIINFYTQEFKAIPSIDRTLANKYGQKLVDIRQWLAMTHWSQQQIGQDKIVEVHTTLSKLQLIDKPLNIDQILQ